MNEELQKGVQILNDGGIVIYPTDTAFGIGCRVDSEESIKRLFRIRKRPESQATPVLVDTVTMAEKYVHTIDSEVINTLIEPYWPGALTIVLSCRVDSVSSLVRGGTDTLGVRIPNHPIPRTLIREVGVGILGPSANFHGEKTPYNFSELDQNLVQLVDYVVPGECTIKQASTVVDCSQKPWKIIRQGAVSIDL